MPLAIIDPAINLDTYVLKQNEFVIYCPVYDTSTGLYRGITKKLGLITITGAMLRRDFFHMVLTKKKELCVVLFHENSVAQLVQLHCI